MTNAGQADKLRAAGSDNGKPIEQGGCGERRSSNPSGIMGAMTDPQRANHNGSGANACNGPGPVQVIITGEKLNPNHQLGMA